MRALGVMSAAVVGLMLMGSAREMRADTVFSNFGSGQTYNGNSWWITGAVPPPPTNTNVEVNAFPFVAATTATVTGADLALSGLSIPTAAVGPAPVTVYIESNSGAGQPGTILDTLTQVGSIPIYPVTSVLNFTCSGTCTTLDAGTTYWIVDQETVAADTAYWMWNITGDVGTWYYNYADSATGPWSTATSTLANGNTFGAFDVTGTASPIPEPGTVLLLGSGLLLVGFLEARRRAWLANHGDR